MKCTVSPVLHGFRYVEIDLSMWRYKKVQCIGLTTNIHFYKSRTSKTPWKIKYTSLPTDINASYTPVQVYRSSNIPQCQ